MSAVPKDHYLWTVVVRGRASPANGENATGLTALFSDGPANIAKAAEVRALVAATAGCTIVKDFHPMEGHGFIYHMANTVESNPLQEYVGLDTRAQVQLKRHRRSEESMREEVVEVSESQVDEGAEFPFTSADELSDDD